MTSVLGYIPAHTSSAYLEACENEGLLNFRNRKMAREVVPALLSFLEEKYGRPGICTASSDAEKQRKVREVAQEFKDQRYGSLWSILLWAVIKMVVMAIIEKWLFS